LLLLLLRAADGRLQRQRGFSLAMVLVVLLVAVVGAGSLALRSVSGKAGSLQLSARREAADAAESGIVAIISELNRPANRRLLVSGTSPDGWGQPSNPNQRNPLLRNPCLQGTTGAAVEPLASLKPAGENTWKSAGGNGQYVLRSVRYSAPTNTFPFDPRGKRLLFRYDTAGSGGTATRTATSPAYDNNVDNDPNSDVNLSMPPSGSGRQGNLGYLQLEVEGRVVRNGTPVATATVVKEYEVIPKCCDRSFSGPVDSSGNLTNVFGNDASSCGGRTADLGLLYGFNGGTLSVSGSAGSVKIVDKDGNIANTNLSSALCVTTDDALAGSNCNADGIKVSDGSIPIVPIVINDVVPVFGGPATTKYLSIGDGRLNYFRVTSNGQDIERCEAIYDKDNVLQLASPPGCIRVDECVKVQDRIADFHCRIESIVLSSATIFFNTSDATIALFFDRAPRPPGAKKEFGKVLVTSGDLRHVYCPAAGGGSALCGANVNDNAPADEFSRLAFYGDKTWNEFQYRGSGSAASIFVFFSNGTIDIGGSSSVAGALWSSDLQLNGNFTSGAPATNCPTTGASSGFCYIAQGGTGTNITPFRFDWVARSPVTTRVY
jgi:hypothetical protein